MECEKRPGYELVKSRRVNVPWEFGKVSQRSWSKRNTVNTCTWRRCSRNFPNLILFTFQPFFTAALQIADPIKSYKKP